MCGCALIRSRWRIRAASPGTVSALRRGGAKTEEGRAVVAEYPFLEREKQILLGDWKGMRAKAQAQDGAVDLEAGLAIAQAGASR
jgi:hypothetical protein